MTFTLIIPAYNEEATIQNTLSYTSICLTSLRFNYDVNLVVLNDGSTDNTRSVVNSVKKQYGVTLVNRKGPTRRENLIKYMYNCKTEYVGFMDCDLATNILYLDNLFYLATKYDIVSGSRYLASSRVTRSLSRRVISWVFNSIVRSLFKSKIRDHECGFKMFNTKKLRKIIDITGIGDTDRRMFWDSEMWVIAQRLDYNILEFPIEWREGKKSALRFKTELSMIKYMMKFWFRQWKS